MKKLVMVTMFAVVAPSASGTAGLQVGVSPFVGGGKASSGKVTAVSGAELAVGYGFALTNSGLTVSPQVQLSNAYVDTERAADGTKTLATYDHRVVALGLNLAHPISLFGWSRPQLYATATTGQVYSKLALASNSPTNATEADYGRISGTYNAAELGTLIACKDHLGITFGGLYSLYREDQSRAGGTYQSDQLGSNGNLTLSGGNRSSTPVTGLQERLSTRTWALKIGLAVGF